MDPNKNFRTIKQIIKRRLEKILNVLMILALFLKSK